MNYHSIVRIKKLLEGVFVELMKSNIHDARIRDRYAEYYVASVLAKKGYQVQLLGERDDKKADLYLQDIDKRIEVKSGIYEDGWAYASFGVGSQIKNDKFDYCVFVTFSEFSEGAVKDHYIFTREELREVIKRRKGVAAHEETNPCLLMRAPSLKAYSNYIKKDKVMSFRIERDLLKHPEKYRNAWETIGGG